MDDKSEPTTTLRLRTATVDRREVAREARLVRMRRRLTSRNISTANSRSNVRKTKRCSSMILLLKYYEFLLGLQTTKEYDKY